MVDAFYADNNRIQVINSDDISFDSSRPSIQLLPESSKLSLSRTVTFPNLLSSPGYFQVTYGTPGAGCDSWSCLMPQEWGPGEANTNPTSFHPPDVYGGTITRNLPEEFLGTVPAGTDYIDVRARITRTQAPPAFMQEAPPRVMFQEGQWFGLPGGSCPCEYFEPLARHFDIELRGTSLYLRRFQSVSYGGGRVSWSDSSPANSYGWFTTTLPSYGNVYDFAPNRFATPAVLMQSLRGGINVNRRAPWVSNATGSCAVYVVDYTSVYSCEFEIHPGRYKPAT